MGWDSLADRLSLGKVPLVLAGPIVRRVTTESASVWLALRDAATVTLDVIDGTTTLSSDPHPTHRIGERLHMVVVTLRHAFTAGAVHRYNVRFTPAVGSGGDLFTPGVVDHTTELARGLLTYESTSTAARPSFMIPPATLDELRIVHTSCRKLAGEGVDAFGAIDVMLQGYFSAAATRPAMLFLTGDNVYTDGSEENVLEILTDASTTLMGFDEYLPEIRKSLSKFPARSAETLDLAGMTGARAFRTYGLGETIALHLMTWADVVWPHERTIDSHGFRHNLTTTRKILANIATYMTFDDHEVGNGWNICFDWVESVFAKPLGRRVYQNCLGAFALCQAWGNTPEQFDTAGQPGARYLDTIEAWSLAKGPSHRAFPRQAELDAQLGIPAYRPDRDELPVAFGQSRQLAELHRAGAGQIRWDFTVPCGQAHVNVLDVHTWTQYSQDSFEPAFHMPPEAWDAQLAEVPPPGTQVAILVISNVAILAPRPWSRLVGILRGTFHMTDHDVAVNDAYQSIKDGVRSHPYKFAAKGIAVLLLMYGIEHCLGWLALIIIVLTVALLLAFISGGGYFPNFPYLTSLWRASRNIYADEFGYNFEWGSEAFERMLARISDRYRQANPSDPARIVILSGDVHSSYAMRLEHWADRAFELQRSSSAVFAQLVSSPSRYVSTKRESYAIDDERYFAGWQTGKPRLLAGVSEQLLWWHRDTPWIAPFHPYEPRKFDGTVPEDWVYKITPVAPSGLPTLTTQTGSPSTLGSMILALDASRRAIATDLAQSTRIRSNNVAEVTFNWNAAHEVTQRVWWWFEDSLDASHRWFLSDFVVPMDATPRPSVP